MKKKDVGTGVDRWKAASGSAGKRRPHRKTPARRWIGTLVVMLVLVGASIWGFSPLRERITQGLDIQGGVSVILSASKADGGTPSQADMDTAVAIVQNRVNALGASESSVAQQGSSSILVQIPGAQDAEAAVETIGQTGHLEFVQMDEIGDAEALAQLRAGTKNVQLAAGSYKSFLDGSYISQVGVAQNQRSLGTYEVNVSFNAEGAKIFADVTSQLAQTNGQIAIVLDGKVYSAPAVQEAITGGQVSITGSFTLEEAKSLKTVLDSGSLPVTLSFSESRVVGPTLGQDSLHAGVLALLVGIVIVALYLFVFYHGLGILTLGSLAIFGVLYLGLLALLSHFGMFALTLPGLAGMVLTTGSAADSSILVLERFREEIRMGKSIRKASISGASHGIRTSLDADVVTLVTALALFFVAVGPVKGFGLTLALGVLCDVVTMFLFKAPALRLLAHKAVEKHPGFWGVAPDLAEANKGGERRA